MQQQSARRAGDSFVMRLHTVLRSGLFALCGLAALWAGSAAALPPSLHCPVINISVAHGGTHERDVSNCDGPANFGIGVVDFNTAHGRAVTVNVDQNVSKLTYTHNGDSALSDTFVFPDGDNGDVTVNVTIAPASSPITVNPATITPQLGVPYSQSMSSFGGVNPYTYVRSGGTLPNGLNFSNGTFSGTVRQRGSFPIQITVTDSTLPTALTTVKSYSISIPNAQPVIGPDPLPPMTRTAPYTATLNSTGGNAPYSYSLNGGALPPGLSLSGVGLISGTPTATGNYSFTVRSVDDSDLGPGVPAIAFGVKTYNVTVAAEPTIVVGPASVPDATIGVVYNQTFIGSGGTVPYTFLSTGTLPTGLILNTSTGTLSGTPTAAGTFNFTIQAKDNNNFTGSRAYTVVVAPPVITIAPVTLLNGAVAVAFNQTISASGGIELYSYSVPPGTLPPGLSLNGTTGALTGTPTGGGTFAFTVTATSNSTGSGAPHTGTRTYNLTINAPTVSLPATSFPVATQGMPFSANLNGASGGTAPYTYALSGGALPPGMNLSSVGGLSGTPSASGNFSFDVVATDSSANGGPYSSTARNYTLQVVNIPPVANPPVVAPVFAYNDIARPVILNITGGVATSVAIASAPAHGTAIASAMTITYQPTTGYAGPDSFTYTATNSAGTSAPATVSLTVGNPTITVTASGPLTAQIGVPYTQTFTWTGGAQPFNGYDVTGVPSLPAGLSVTGTTNDSVTLSGTPTAAGTFSLTAVATDSSTGSGPFTEDEVFVLTISAPTLSMTPAAGTLPATYGVAYSQTFIASGGSPAYTYAVSTGLPSLPPGLSLDTATGVLSGTPTAPGTYAFSIRVTDSSTGSGAPFSRTQNYVVQVPPVSIAVAPVSLPGAQIGAAYTASVSASGGIGPYTFSIPPGSEPPGLSMAADGTLSGTPTAGGTINFTAIATDANGHTGNRPYIFTVAAPIIAIAPASLPDGGIAQPYAATLTASGGTQGIGYQFSVPPGDLPNGLSLASNGVLSGTPSAGGTFAFTVTATDRSTGAGPYSGTQNYSVTINPSTIVLPPTTLANATRHSPYNASINAATGGTSPYSYTPSGALPPGIAFSSSGQVSGTPTQPGTYTFSATATDSSTGTGPYTSAAQSYTLVVNDIVPIANPVLPDPLIDYGDAPQSITLDITGGTASSVAIATAPAHGTAIASGMTITYQPAAGYAGADSFTYTASNSVGTSAPALIRLTVKNPTIRVTESGPMTAQVGASYTQTFTWAGGMAPYREFSAAGLPGGLIVTATSNDSLTVSGTPTEAGGAIPITVSAKDSSTGNGPFIQSKAYVLAVSAPTLAMTPAAGNLPMNYGVATTINFAASGGTVGTGYVFSLAAGVLPNGVGLTSSGVLSGTPTVPGTYNLVVRVQDQSTGTGAPFVLQQSYTIVVATPVIAIDPPALPNGTAAAAYDAQFSATGGVAPYSFSLLSGALPIGLAFNSAGAVSGVPRSDGNFSLTVQATDSNGQTASKVYTFTIDPATVAISPATLPGGVVGTAYNQSLSSNGGIAPYSYSIVSGNLPIGLSFSSAGALSGTPSTAGSYTANIRSTDAAGYNITAPYTIVIADATPVAVDDSASTLANQAVTVNVTANDTGIIAAVAVDSAPSHGAATVSGVNVIYTPTSNYFGSDSFTYTASGPGGTSAPATVAITVNALPVPVGQPQNVTTLSTQAVVIDAANGASGSPFTGVTLLAPPSSGTAVVQGATQILYTPAADTSGAIALSYTLNNAFGASAPITSIITVNPVPVAVSRRVRTIAGATITVDLTLGARGGPFTGATLVSLTPASAGEAVVSGSGGVYQLRYSPPIGYSGVTVATFTLSNAFATSASATIEVEVAPRSDPSKDPEVLGILNAQTEAARRFANSQIGNFQQRMEGLHDGGTSGTRFDNGLSFSIDPRCRDEARRTPGSDCRQPALGDESAALEPKPAVEGTGPQYGVWTGGTINSGNRDGRGGGSAGLDFETSGISLGADYRINRNFAFGGGLGYGRDDTEVGQRGSRSKGESYSAVLYASYHPGESFYLDGLLGYQWLSFDSSRYVTDTGGRVRGSRDGNQWFASISAGMEYQRDRLRVSPYARLDVARATLDGYTEQGDAQYVLKYQNQDVETTTTSLGLRIDYRYAVRWGTFSPQLRLEYQYDFQNDSFATMSYADMAGGPFFRARLDGLDRNRFVFGLGAVLQTERDWALRFEYRGLFGSGNDDDNGFMINIEKKY
ncbi:putative Ig domain-containing protein [Lysobacter sp. CA199]|uniref:putative Ig domain-containing protein n=1 Tax=Lysobacter sp. CA199 TaxID=3455608 RepID=UPI003F8D74AA